MLSLPVNSKWFATQGCHAIIVILACATVNISAGADRAAPEAIEREVLQVWRDRQAATPHLSFSWTSADYDRYSMTMDENATPQIREVNATTTEKGRIAYGEGDQIRLDVTRADGYEVFEVFADDALTVFSPHEPALGYPLAGIGRGTVPTAWRYYPGTPMRLCFRPFLDTAGFDGLENAKCVARDVLYRGEMCDELTWGYHEVLVSTDDERLPLRYRCWRPPEQEKIFSETAIEYDRDTPHGSVPVRWEFTKFGIDGETVVKSSVVTLDQYELNEPPPRETFSISYPPGTWVDDRIDNLTYIVRDGKPNRMVLPGEFTGDNYEQLLNSEPPDLRAKSGGGMGWFWLGNGVLIAAIAGVWYWRARTRRTLSVARGGGA